MDRLIHNLERYGVGPRMCGLLETFWYHQKEVPRQNGYHGLALTATWVTTQGVLVSAALFNVDVENVIRTWLAMTVEDQKVAHNGLLELVRR